MHCIHSFTPHNTVELTPRCTLHFLTGLWAVSFPISRLRLFYSHSSVWLCEDKLSLLSLCLSLSLSDSMSLSLSVSLSHLSLSLFLIWLSLSSSLGVGSHLPGLCQVSFPILCEMVMGTGNAATVLIGPHSTAYKQPGVLPQSLRISERPHFDWPIFVLLCRNPKRWLSDSRIREHAARLSKGFVLHFSRNYNEAAWCFCEVVSGDHLAYLQ